VFMVVEEKLSVKINHIIHNNVKRVEKFCGDETKVEMIKEDKHKRDMVVALPLLWKLQFWVSYCFLVEKTFQVSFHFCSNLYCR